MIGAGASLIVLVMRVRQAALRHQVWTGVVAVMLLLPAWVAWGPKRTLPLLPVDSWQRRPLSRTAIPSILPLQSTVVDEGKVAIALSAPQSWRWRAACWPSILRAWVCFYCGSGLEACGSEISFAERRLWQSDASGLRGAGYGRMAEARCHTA